MAANTSLEVTGLDFESNRANLVNFLRSQPRFKDIDYTGSNIAVLLDLLAYTTYQTAFYTNMVAGEMFLDSAQMRSSVVSHAKELNYLPRSFRSAQAQLTLRVTPDSPTDAVTVPAGTSFTAKVGSNTFTFSLPSTTVLNIANANGMFELANTTVYEGVHVTDSFVFDSSNTYQRFTLGSPTIDTDSIEVTVVEDGGETFIPYIVSTTLFDLTTNNNVCFLQATGSDNYELFFGNNKTGRKPKDGAVIITEYRTCSGELPNGADTFVTNGPIDGHSNVEVVILSTAVGGAVSESVEEIRFNAPRYFQTQERAVTSGDYITLLRNEFPEINAINAFGGEDTDPPQFGKVVLSIDVNDADGVSESNKQRYREFLQSRMPLSIDPVFINPEFIYLNVNTIVRYNVNVTDLSAQDIQALVAGAIQEFDEINLSNFNTTLRFSRFTKAIDDADASILSNDTEVTAYKTYVPSITKTNSFTLNFYNPVLSVATTPFYYNDKQVMIKDNGTGTLQVVSYADKKTVVINRIGTINYTNGRVTVSNLSVSQYPSYGIKFTVTPDSKDIAALRNNIVTIRDSDVVVSVRSERV